MRQPTDTALKRRARALLEAMTERARWIYAVPPSSAAAVREMIEAGGFRCEEEDAGAHVARFVDDRGGRVVTFDSAELEVLLIEASGSEAPPLLSKVLDATGFYAQSELIKTALDVGHAECAKALRTLAHMVVAWDEDWTDLFLLHLASPDPIVRHEAALSVTVAAMVAREPEPAVALLEEAARRETFPKLRETLAEAIATVRAATGGAVTPPVDAD